MSRRWTDEELQAASEANKAAGFLSFPEFKVELGLAILEEDFMKPHGYSRAKLAEALGTSRQNVSQIFKGTQYFTVKQIRVIAELFNMTAEDVCECFALI